MYSGAGNKAAAMYMNGSGHNEPQSAPSSPAAGASSHTDSPDRTDGFHRARHNNSLTRPRLPCSNCPIAPQPPLSLREPIRLKNTAQ